MALASLGTSLWGSRYDGGVVGTKLHIGGKHGSLRRDRRKGDVDGGMVRKRSYRGKLFRDAASS